MAFYPTRGAWFVGVAFIEVEEDLVLALEVIGGLPGGFMVFPLHQVMETIFIMAIE